MTKLKQTEAQMQPDKGEIMSIFDNLKKAAGTSPFQTAALTVCTLCAYAATPEIGIEMLNFLKGLQPLSEYDKQFLRDRFATGKHIPFSYFEGASAENDYTPSLPFKVKVQSDGYSYENEGYAKLFIPSGGADAPRPLVLRQKGRRAAVSGSYGNST